MYVFAPNNSKKPKQPSSAQAQWGVLRPPLSPGPLNPHHSLRKPPPRSQDCPGLDTENSQFLGNPQPGHLSGQRAPIPLALSVMEGSACPRCRGPQIMRPELLRGAAESPPDPWSGRAGSSCLRISCPAAGHPVSGGTMWPRTSPRSDDGGPAGAGGGGQGGPGG